MTQGANPWLPPGTRSDIEAAMAGLVQNWARDWFVGSLTPQLTQTPKTALRRLIWHGGGSAAVGCEQGADLTLGRALCGGTGDPDNPQDRALLQAVAEAACFALAKALGGLVDGPRAAVPLPAPVWAADCFLLAAPDHGWSIALALSEAALVSARKAKSASGWTPPLGTIPAAVADEPCSLALHLGTAQLNAAELASICLGDVIVFDRATTQPLPLMVEGKHPVQGSAKLENDGRALRVSITTPISMISRETAPV